MSNSKISLENGGEARIEMVKTNEDNDTKILSYTTQVFMKKNDLNDKLELNLILEDDKKMKGSISINLKSDLSESEQATLEFKFINREIFNIIQMI